MSGSEALRQRALVVSPLETERERACQQLGERGYDAVGFSDCQDACAWLEEETPVVAVVSTKGAAPCSAVVAVLRERGLQRDNGQPGQNMLRLTSECTAD